MANIRMLLGLSLAALPLAGATQSAAQGTAQPSLTREQTIQLFEAAGFRVENGRAMNRCGGASNPRVAFADLNGDGRAEAHVADLRARIEQNTAKAAQLATEIQGLEKEVTLTNQEVLPSWRACDAFVRHQKRPCHRTTPVIAMCV